MDRSPAARGRRVLATSTVRYYFDEESHTLLDMSTQRCLPVYWGANPFPNGEVLGPWDAMETNPVLMMHGQNLLKA